MKHLELFSGIGGFRQAIDLLAKDFDINAECIGYSEIDQYAQKVYEANYNTKGEIKLGDIVEFTSKKENIEKLPSFSLLTGGFPCQSFSMMGNQKGFKDIRGNVFFQIINILQEKKTPLVLLENVRNLATHDKGNTLRVIRKSLEEIGYKNVFSNVFNTQNFGLAQKRNRVYIFATTLDLPSSFDFTQKVVLKSFKEAIKKNNISLLTHKDVLDVLSKTVDEKYYLSETLKPIILSDGSKNFKSKSEINKLIARPLTATMMKMHRACQDNYYSEEFLTSDCPYEYLEQEFSKEEQAKHRIRKLTPKEAFLLQGFNEDFVSNAEKIGVSNHQLYKQAGNAVSVNTVYAILHYLLITNNLRKLC